MRRIIVAAILALLPLGAVAQIVSGGGSPLAGQHPGYVVNNWYTPLGYQTTAAAPVINGANVVSCSFGIVAQSVTLNSLGGRITTLSAGGNVQFAVYNVGSWGRPSTLVVATASITTAAAAVVNAAAVASLAPGSYFFCQNVDNAVAILTAQSTGANTAIGSPYLGSSTQGSSGTGPGGNVTGISVAQTFGTWPAFISGTAWADIGTSFAPYVAFRVGSVP